MIKFTVILYIYTNMIWYDDNKFELGGAPLTNLQWHGRLQWPPHRS